MNKDIEQQRKELWCAAWVATARSDSCVNDDTPTKYADKALKDFDERFPKPETK